MITHIHLENFKGIKERQTIELKPITLLFGPNSAGKSTIIQALHYAREILDRRNYDPDKTETGGDMLDLGGFKNLVHGHDINQPIIMRFEYKLSESELIHYLELVTEYHYEETGDIFMFDRLTELSDSCWVEIKIEWHRGLNKALVTEYKTAINNEEIAHIVLDRYTADGKVHFKISWINFDHPVFNSTNYFETEDDKQTYSILMYAFEGLMEDQQIPDELNLLYQDSAIPRWDNNIEIDNNIFPSHQEKPPENLRVEGEEKNHYANAIKLKDTGVFIGLLSIVLVRPGQLVQEVLKKFRYIGPIREILPRHYKPTLSPNENQWASGLGAWDLLFKEPENYLKKVNRFLADEKYLNSGYEIIIKEFKKLLLEDPAVVTFLQGRLFDEEDRLGKQLLMSDTFKEIAIRDNENDIDLSLVDVGVGISQVIPVIVGAVAQTSSILAIEQPELHIHPKMQVSLSDVFINQINSSQKTLYILETHSEHIMLRILRRITETTDEEVEDDNLHLEPDKISVNWFQPTEKGITIIQLPIDKFGEFTKDWPQGFFEERIQELFG